MNVEKKCVSFPVCAGIQWVVTCAIVLMDINYEEERIPADV
jgi:hypothetical protein